MPRRDPTTIARNRSRPFVLGVDGCRAGWVVVRLDLLGGETSGFLAPRFADLLASAGAEAAMMIVDMPIGLADRDRRACEMMARQKLKPQRSSSVFSSPRRPMLDFATYEQANAWGKAHSYGGLSKQAWMITPKIREIDDAVTPASQARLGEGHPEVAFARLKGRPCSAKKSNPEGHGERRALLESAGVRNAEEIFLSLRAQHGAAALARDDVYDACALALTAKARLEDSAIHLTDGKRDERGLIMEIWG